jgi:hypothetical protein
VRLSQSSGVGQVDQPSVASRALVGLGAAAGAAILGVLVVGGSALPVALIFILGVAMYVGMRNWRWSVYALLAYFPVSGIPIIALYPNTGPAALIKDFLFVIPAYAGFFGAAVVSRRRIRFAGFPVISLALFVAIVVAQAFNPFVSSPIAALVGIKVWLFYIPMVLLGFHLIDSREELGRLLALLSLTAAIPALIGIIEAALVYSGQADVVHGWYGAAASAATQGYGQLNVGGAQIQRIPSTFSFGAQYLVFVSCMVAVTFAWWRGGFTASESSTVQVAQKGLAALLCLLMTIAAFLSGSRGAFVMVPSILVVAVLLERRRGLGRGVILAAPVIALLVAGAVFGASSTGLVKSIAGHVSNQFSLVFTGGVHAALQVTTVGLGTGTETNAARYILHDPTTAFTLVGGRWQESWYVKALVELGVLGLILLVALLCAFLARALRDHRGLMDPGLRSVSAALLALVIIQVIYNLKAQYPDMDPLNVYLWLFMGLIAKVAVLDRRQRQPSTRETKAEALIGIRTATRRPSVGIRPQSSRHT